MQPQSVGLPLQVILLVLHNLLDLNSKETKNENVKFNLNMHFAFMFTGSGLKVKTLCTTTTDAVCEPQEGFFCLEFAGEDCRAAQKHRSCDPGQYISQKGWLYSADFKITANILNGRDDQTL